MCFASETTLHVFDFAGRVHMLQAPGSRGDLRIHFDILFPRVLTDEQKAQLRRVLPPG